MTCYKDAKDDHLTGKFNFVPKKRKTQTLQWYFTSKPLVDEVQISDVVGLIEQMSNKGGDQCKILTPNAKLPQRISKWGSVFDHIKNPQE